MADKFVTPNSPEDLTPPDAGTYLMVVNPRRMATGIAIATVHIEDPGVYYMDTIDQNHDFLVYIQAIKQAAQSSPGGLAHVLLLSPPQACSGCHEWQRWVDAFRAVGIPVHKRQGGAIPKDNAYKRQMGQYFRELTNLPPDEFPPQQVAAVGEALLWIRKNKINKPAPEILPQ